jgi:lipoic acid synthetase
VHRYWHPDEFEALGRAAREIGFESVASGPLVRSSYHADESAREAQETLAAGTAA